MAIPIVEYLFDSSVGDGPGSVFLTLWPTDEIVDVRRAMDFLRAQERKPLALVPMQWGTNLKVIVEVSANPRIWFGHEEASGNWEADLTEIIRVLREHGIEAELALDCGPSLPRRG